MEGYVIYDKRNNGFVKNLQGRNAFAGCFELGNAIIYSTEKEANNALNKIQRKWHRQLSVRPVKDFIH